MPAVAAALRGPVGGPKGLLLGAVAGALVAFSIPPFGWWPLAWIGFAVLAATLPGRNWPVRMAVGGAFGIVNYTIGLLWVQEFSVPGYIAVVVVSALYSMVAMALVPAGRRGSVAVALPCLLVLADWGRDRFPLGGLPLGGAALGQAAGPLAPVLRLGGSLALVGETVLVGIALAELARIGWHGASRRWPTRTQAAKVAAAALAAVALPLIGTVAPDGSGGGLRPLRVALVQGGGPRGTRAIDTDPQVVFNRHLAESRFVQDPVDLIVWPEGVLQSHSPFTRTVDAESVADLARTHDATVVAGVEQDVGSTHYLNEVVTWTPAGITVSSYVKNHLVPFGEYVPYRSLIRDLFNVADVPLDAIPGHSTGLLKTPAAPLAVMISYEVFFDERARGGVRAGGQILVVPTNTASYRSTQVPTQEVAADKLRAWETGRWLIQVTPTGYTTVVGPTGSVSRKTRLDAAQVVEATVPRRTGMTVYDHIGDATVAGAALAGWLVTAGLSSRGGRRRFQNKLHFRRRSARI